MDSGRWLAAVVIALAPALPALGQDQPEISPEETAAATAAVDAANLTGVAYRNLWCAGYYAWTTVAPDTAASPAAEARRDSRDALYRKAATELLAAGLTQTDFSSIAENVYALVVNQMTTAAAEAEFAPAVCEAASAP